MRKGVWVLKSITCPFGHSATEISSTDPFCSSKQTNQRTSFFFLHSQTLTRRKQDIKTKTAVCEASLTGFSATGQRQSWQSWDTCWTNLDLATEMSVSSLKVWMIPLKIPQDPTEFSQVHFLSMINIHAQGWVTTACLWKDKMWQMFLCRHHHHVSQRGGLQTSLR